MNDAEIEDDDQITRKKLTLIQWMVELIPDGGDGLHGYPQDGAGGVIHQIKCQIMKNQKKEGKNNE